MQKISDSTATATPAGEFTEGSAVGGIPATLIKAAWLTALQRELVAVIEAAGFELDPENDAQLLASIVALSAWGNISGKPATFPPSGHVHDWSSIEAKPNAVKALSLFSAVSVDTVLTSAQMGFITIDAAAGNRLITLPEANADLGVVDVIVRRVDNSGNRLKVQASGANKIKFHTHLNAAGYGFLYLMGAGDWWHLRSDGQGSWWPIGRLDSDALGRPVFETTTMVSPGGWGVLAGGTFSRVDWPWTWDHAQQSGMLTTEAGRVGMEGGWTSGDGVATCRGPEGRGEFMRLLDEGRGIDASRVAGSFAADTLQGHEHTLIYPFTGSGGGGLSTSLDTSPNSGILSNKATTIVSAAGYGAVRVGSQTQPRSIAYPGRIKLI